MSFTVQGRVQNLAGPGSLTGHTEVSITELDLALVSALAPMLSTLQPRGHVQDAEVRLALEGEQGLVIDASLNLRQVQWQGLSETAKAGLARLQVRLQGRWQGNQWSCETLVIEAPGGLFALHDRAWMQVDDATWRGHVAFTLNVNDMQPVTQVLGKFLPNPLRMEGRLQATGEVDGMVSRASQQPWATRLLDLRASLDGSLARTRWGSEEVSGIVTKLRLEEGELRVTQASAKVAGGEVMLQGQLSLKEATSSGGLQWQITNIPLHTVLGKPLQYFIISKASGRITHDRDGYHLESVVQIPKFALQRAELDDRELRLTRAALHCKTTMASPLARLTIDTCTLQAAEARLSLRDVVVEFGSQPRLTVQVKGWLSGKFVNALVPEAPIQFPEPVDVDGPVIVPLHGKVWVGMQWRLAVKSDRHVFEEMVFTDLRATVVKMVGRLDIPDFQARRGSGRLQGSGSWHLGGPANWTMQMQAHQVPLQQPLVRDAPGGPYVLEGTVAGPVTIQTGKDGIEFVVDQQVRALRLRHGSAMLAQLPAAQIHGTIGRERDGTLWARQLGVLGDALTITIQDGRLPARAADPAGFQVDGSLDAESPWLTAMLGIVGAKGLVVSGRTQAVVQAQGRLHDILKTTQGKGTVQTTGVSFRGQTFSFVDAAYALTPGRLQIVKGLLGYQEGRLEVQGSLGLPPALGTPDDSLAVTLHSVPVQHAHQLQSFRQQGAATLKTHAMLSGQVDLRNRHNGELNGIIDVQVAETIRQVRQDDRVLAEVKLPPVRLTGEVTAVGPVERLRATTLLVQGDGLTVELKDVEARRMSSHYDIAGALQLQASAEVVQGLILGLLSETIQPQGALKLAGTAGMRIPLEGKVEAQHVSYTGELSLEDLMVNNTVLESLAARLRLDEGRLTVADATTELLGGRGRLGSPSFVVLQGPARDFHVHLVAEQLNLQVQSGRRLALSRMLFLLSPLFLSDPERDKPVDVTGVFEGEIQLTGSYDGKPGWSKSVNGDGHFRIDQGAVLGSTLVSGFISKTLLLPMNVVNNTLKGLFFAKDGKVGTELRSLGKRAFVFGTLESPIQVRSGEVHLKKDLTVTSPELGMVINGHSTLEGEVDYHARSDLIHRIRFGEITSLPNKIPLLGKVIRYVNPFTMLEDIELEATVRGNVFRTKNDGHPDVQVDTSIIR
jgi:hypothetical protein